MPKPTLPSHSQSWMYMPQSVLTYLGRAAFDHFLRGLAFACDYAMPGVIMPYDELPLPPESWAYFIATLFLFPLTVLGGVAGLSIVPLIFYSFIEKFPYHLMAPIRWIYADKKLLLQSLQNSGLRSPLSGGFYGLPGILLGSAIGLVITSGIWLKRTMESTYRFNRELFKFVKYQTLAFVNKQPLRQHPLDQHDEEFFSNFEVLLGLLPVGWALGIAISTVTFSTFILGLAIKHSAISFYRSLARQIKAAVKDQLQKPSPPDEAPSQTHHLGLAIKHSVISFYRSLARQINAALQKMPPSSEDRNPRQLTLGIPGRLIGLSIGSALFAMIIIARMIENIPEHVYRNFCRAVRAIQPKDTSLHHFFTLPKDKRTPFARSLGILGIFPLGLVSGILGLILGSFLRLGALSANALAKYCQSTLNEEEEKKGLLSDKEDKEKSLNTSSSDMMIQRLAQQQPNEQSPRSIENVTMQNLHHAHPQSASLWYCWMNLFSGVTPANHSSSRLQPASMPHLKCR